MTRTPLAAVDLTGLPPAPKRPEPDTDPAASRRLPQPVASDHPKPSVSRASDGGAVATTITLPVGMRAQLRDRARVGDTTTADVILTALTEHVDELGHLVAREKPATITRGPFPDTAVTQRRLDHQPRESTYLRLTRKNLAVLDDLVAEHDADSRSQLITAALRAHL